MRVIVHNGDVMKAYRKLKKKLHNEGVIQSLMDNRHYQKPSEVRRRKKMEAKRRSKKAERDRHSNL